MNSPNKANPVRTLAFVVIAIAVLGLAAWLVVRPQVEFARVTRHANGLVTSLIAQPKFRDVRVLAEKTNGLALVVTGHVATEADLAELRTWVDSTQPSVPVTWVVAVKQPAATPAK